MVMFNRTVQYVDARGLASIPSLVLYVQVELVQWGTMRESLLRFLQVDLSLGGETGDYKNIRFCSPTTSDGAV